jgi:hypothetical protein
LDREKRNSFTADFANNPDFGRSFKSVYICVIRGSF